MTKTKTFRRKRTNPLHKRRPGVPRPKVAFDGTTMRSAYYSALVTTNSINQGAQYYYVDTRVAATGAANSLASTLNLYSQYKFDKLSFEFIPSVSPGTADAGSRLHIAYIDNPEKMGAFINLVNAGTTSSTTAALNAVRGSRNSRTFNAWERFTYNVPLTWRRKVFDTNTSDAIETIESLERHTQGLLIIAVETLTALANVGTWRINSTVSVRELNIALPTTA